LFWLYTEPERRAKQTTKHTPLSVSVYKQNKQQNSLFFQALYITKANNKAQYSFDCALLFVLVI
jgi:hypothetical protein